MKTICILGVDGAGKSSTIPHICRRLEFFHKNVISVSTTKPIPDLSVSHYWRAQLVDKDTTAFERFNAAISLYEANVKFHLSSIRNLQLVDYFVLDRGGSSFVTFNKIHRIDQFAMIPKVNAGIYFTAPFEVLSERLSERGGTDFQDTDYTFRKQVFETGIADFDHWLTFSDTKGLIYDTSIENVVQNAHEIANWILKEV